MTEFRPIALPTRTAEIMAQHDIKMKKSLGQNFLVEPKILQKMVDVAEVDEGTTVIEIGPGIGALTEFIARQAKEVVTFEIDKRFVAILEDTLAPYDNVTVIPQDILKVDWTSPEYDTLRHAERLVVVANLPYYITTPIIMHLIQSGLPFERLVMLMQKEVAERMTATVGTKAYNSLSIAIQNQMEGDVAFIVPKNVFIPKPNVDSAVLVLTRRATPQVEVANLAEFEQFVQVAFTQRRKTLWNNIKLWATSHHIALDQVELAFQRAEIEPSRRAETLTVQEFKRLYDSLEEI